MKKRDLLAKIEELQGTILALEEKIDILKADLHGSRNPYMRAKPLIGTDDWHTYARSIINHIHINR